MTKCTPATLCTRSTPFKYQERRHEKKKPIIPRVVPSKIEINVGRNVGFLPILFEPIFRFRYLVEFSSKFSRYYGESKRLNKKRIGLSFSYVIYDHNFRSSHSLLTNQTPVSANRNKSESFL